MQGNWELGVKLCGRGLFQAENREKRGLKSPKSKEEVSETALKAAREEAMGKGPATVGPRVL